MNSQLSILDMHALRRLIVLIPALCISSRTTAYDSQSLTPEQVAQVAEAANNKRGETTFWRSDELGLIFGYDERWKQVQPSQRNTKTVISWTTRASGGLMATCYIEAMGNSGLSKLSSDQVSTRGKAIVDSYMRNLRMRDPKAKLILWKNALQDNYPVVYIERESHIETINGEFGSRSYSVVTIWKNHEVNFECGSRIPVDFPEFTGVVEGPIKKVLGSLQFVRDPG